MPSLIAALLLGTLALAVVALLMLSDEANRSRRLRERASGVGRPSRLRRIRLVLDGRLRAQPRGRALEARLRGAGLSVSPLDFVLAVAGICLVVVLVLYRFLGNLGSVVVALAVVAFANRWIENRRRKRLEAFVAQLPEVARVLSNAASAGLALRSALGLAAKELEEPAGPELREVSDQLALGAGLSHALDDLRRRLPSRELGVLVQTLVIQSRAGGALVSALNNIATTLEQRKELRREVRTAVSGAMFSGYAVLGIAVGAVLVMNLMTPGALDQLAQTTIGRIVLLAAATFFGVGLFIIRRITDIEV